MQASRGGICGEDVALATLIREDKQVDDEDRLKVESFLIKPAHVARELPGPSLSTTTLDETLACSVAEPALAEAIDRTTEPSEASNSDIAWMEVPSLSGNGPNLARSFGALSAVVRTKPETL